LLIEVDDGKSIAAELLRGGIRPSRLDLARDDIAERIANAVLKGRTHNSWLVF
jgi:hypothetical protein